MSVTFMAVLCKAINQNRADQDNQYGMTDTANKLLALKLVHGLHTSTLTTSTLGTEVT